MQNRPLLRVLAVDPSATSFASACRCIVRDGGLPAFYRGVGPAVLGIAPYMAIELGVFDSLPQQVPSFARGFMAALLATSGEPRAWTSAPYIAGQALAWQ